jgi:hypothetical protein
VRASVSNTTHPSASSRAVSGCSTHGENGWTDWRLGYSGDLCVLVIDKGVPYLTGFVGGSMWEELVVGGSDVQQSSGEIQMTRSACEVTE